MAEPFYLGRLMITRNAQRTLDPDDVILAIHRHSTGDWGDLDDEDKKANEVSLQEGSRIISAYRDGNGTRFWVITEAGGYLTTVLLPEDY